MEEGIQQWANTLGGIVVGAETTRENMERYVKVKWRQIVAPTVTKLVGIFSVPISFS